VIRIHQLTKIPTHQFERAKLKPRAAHGLVRHIASLLAIASTGLVGGAPTP
jgi:hypothetical protein